MEFAAVAFLRIHFVEVVVAKLLAGLVQIFGNYGIAIIITTIIVRALMLPLSLKQERAMAKMKVLQPKIDKINKQYKGDKAKIQEATAQLYKDEKVNPAAGCLPLLIQLPIFIALYYTFLGNSVPDTASFLWFNLKQPDSLFMIGTFSVNVLPIISAVLMVVQQKLMNGATGEGGAMQNAMLFMPIMMMVIFYRFPAGVNLYYVVNTILSIVQQQYVSKKVRLENEQN